MEYISQDGINLLKLAQSGNTVAEDTLIRLIKDKFMNKRIGRYLYRNRQAETDDLKQEFLIGVALNIHKARIDIGDPIEYLINQGVYRVRSYLRKNIIQNTIQICRDCGNKSRLNKNANGNGYICKKCGSIHIDTHELDDHNDILLENIIEELDIEDQVLSTLFMKEFENTLTQGTNVCRLYELLKSGINRQNPEIKNYIKEIAKLWGNCSEQNVVRNIEKLRNRIEAFARQNNAIIKNGVFIIIDGGDNIG